ncbi:hypothetical protein HDV01_004482 [Terramyces sp. JEL0728]|nr:hypothetical protein HDV01_004482 [Terramyces sp. JEL0728]
MPAKHRTDIEYIEIVEVLYDYVPTEDGMLALKQGDLIYVHSKDNSGWWNGTPEMEEVSKQLEELIADDDKEADEDKDTVKELPEFWRKKRTASGQTYYYNTNTNQTTYNLNEVNAPLKKRASLIWKDNEVVANQDIKALPTPKSTQWIAGPQTLLEKGASVSWEVLINNILQSISDLNFSAKNGIKQNYTSQSAQIITAVRDMLSCSGTVSVDSPTIKQNRALATYHKSIMASMSRMILAAKVASGIWPPPDAVRALRHHAGQVLLSVRNFVSTAQDLNLLLESAPNVPVEEFDIKGNDLSQAELLSNVEQTNEVVMNSVANLITKITRDKALSTHMIDLVKKTVAEVGQLLSFMEEIDFEDANEGSSSEEYSQKKQVLYTTLNALVSAAHTGEDGFAPANAVNSILDNSTALLKAVEEFVTLSKVLIDQSSHHFEKKLHEENENSDLLLLQKRAQELSFLEYGQGAASATSQSSKPSSPSPWSRERTTSGETERKGSVRYSGGSFNTSRNSTDNNSSYDTNSIRPWILKNEVNYDLSFNKEGAVNGGTFLALVERLTVHDQPIGRINLIVDPIFLNSFLMTFHCFGTGQQLLQCLKDRFNLEPPQGITSEEFKIWTDKKLNPIQQRVCNTLKTWIESYWINRFDEACLDDVHDFAAGKIMESQPVLATQILGLVTTMINSDVYGTPFMSSKTKKIIKPEEYQPPILPKNLKRFSVLDLDPLEVARQLTILYSSIFIKIQPVELMNQEFAKKYSNIAVNVRAMSDVSNKITGWIISCIVQEENVKNRAAILKFFVKVACKLLALNNFHALFAVQSAFSSSTVSRLNRTWSILSEKTMVLFHSINQATDINRNYAEYRQLLKRATLPAIPFLGLFLTDLTFTDDGNANTRNNGRLINFDKYAKTARIIKELTNYQVPYAITEVAEIQDFLRQVMYEHGNRDPQELYDISLRLEPRTPTNTDNPELILEHKIEMLLQAEDVTKELEETPPVSPANTTLDRDNKAPEQLPQFWRKKETPSGQVYYYNTQTNQTTYNLEQTSVKKRVSLIWKQNGVVANHEGKPLPSAPQSASWVPGPKSLLTDVAEINWEILINNILKSISDLNYSAKNDIKSNYVQQSGQIVRAIRDMLGCSGTISSESVIIQSNRALAQYHQNIMASLSKIILAAKVAAGLWPPPDAVHSMRYQAGQVLLAVRHFVAVAQDLGITLGTLPEDAADEFDVKGNELSDTEMVTRLDQNCEIIMNSIATLVTKITRDRALSTGLIDMVRKTVTEIGQLLSIIEDIRFDTSLDVDNLVADFMQKKGNLYTVLNDLVSASSTGEDGFAPANALGLMLESATSVLESVEDIVVAAKLLIDHKELILQKSLQSENEKAEDSDLLVLQKRAQALNFLDNRNSQSSAHSITSGQYPPSSVSPGGNWSRDGRTLSAESRLNSGAPTQEQYASYRKGSITGIQSGRRVSQEAMNSPQDMGSASKLSQFFGEEPVSQSARNMRPWFLRKETTYDLSYNMEGAVNGGTFPALVERLTVHDQPVGDLIVNLDPGFAQAFLMTFHLFGNSETLFRCLQSRFLLDPPQGLTPEELNIWVEKKLTPVQRGVCNALKMWIEQYWLESSDDSCLDDIHAFASGAMMEYQPQAATKILELVSKKVTTDVYGTAAVTPKLKRANPQDYQAPILPKNLKRFTLTDLDPLEVARQLTILEANIFMKIQPVELMKQEWSRKNGPSLAINVRGMTAMATKITGWVICTILQEADLKRRAFILKFFIKVAELLSSKTRGAFEVLKKATDHSRNYADYRQALKRSALPTLPFLGLFLTDLTFTEDGNPDMRNNGKLINFDKYSHLTRYQVPYPITEVPEIQDYLQQSIQDRGTRDVQDLYELSLRLEPRDERASAGSGGPEEVNRELEAKIEMLQKAGML